MSEVSKIAGFSFSGGRKDDFYFCLMEYYPDQGRWFLSSILQLKDEAESQGDLVINEWVRRYQIENLIVDFPVTSYACQNCKLTCPGQHICPVTEVQTVREKIQGLLLEDERLYGQDPKAYEEKRNMQMENLFSKNPLNKNPTLPLLSRAFKRKLKKGYLPYWNRPVDFWIWCEYYDALLELFSNSYDSYGNVSLKLVHRFQYLRKHLPAQVGLYESHIGICLLECLRSGYFDKKTLRELSDLELGVAAREQILKVLEKKCEVFIYERDMEVLIHHPRAFESFLLAIAGQRFVKKHMQVIPNWARGDASYFVAPKF